MRLTHESPRTRWWILLAGWTLLVTLSVWHTLVLRDYIAQLDRAGQRTPAVSTPLQRACPSNYADAQMWLRYALALQEGAPWQVRQTELDNAPAGREVHWSSGLAHLLAAAGRLQHALTGEPLPHATEQAMMWFNLPLLLTFAAIFSVWAARRAGAAAGVLVAVGAIGIDDLYAGFSPNYVDHHGLLSAAVFGVVLGAMFMGGGWWRAADHGEEGLLPESPAAARRAATVSAVCGAFGLWISAATVIPALAIVGVAAVIATWCGAGAARREGAQFDADLWRWWGRLGAALSVGFYLLEYAPSHLGVRLEVNHPFHALAWWGGAELIALLAGWRASGPGSAFPFKRLVLPLAALSVSPVAVALLGARAFVAGDPFVAQLSNNVAEGITMWRTVEVFGWGPFFWHVNFQLVPLAFGAVLVFRRAQPDRILLGFGTLATLLFVAMSCWKVRWWLNAGGPLLALLLVSLAAWLRARSPRTRWLVVGAVVMVGFFPAAFIRVSRIREAVRHREAGGDDLIQPVFRDIAGVLRSTQPKGDIVLLASPNASVAIGYYGRFKTIGTLYWENTAGLRAAAEIFCAPTDNEARELILRRGITHLAMVSQENYLAEYFALLHPQAAPSDFEKTFGARLMFQFQVPQWLRPIPYQPPASVRLPGLVVRLFQVAPNQSVAEAYWHLATAEIANGAFADAERKIERALAALPAGNHAEDRVAAANLFYRAGAHAAAVRFFRAALAERDNPETQRNLAWVLATSPDDAVRNGREALAIVERLAPQMTNDPTFDSVAAAALAESGRFNDAVILATRALNGARAAGDKTAETLDVKRLDAYRAGRPWRQ